jgi:hypothetical protein
MSPEEGYFIKDKKEEMFCLLHQQMDVGIDLFPHCAEAQKKY